MLTMMIIHFCLVIQLGNSLPSYWECRCLLSKLLRIQH